MAGGSRCNRLIFERGKRDECKNDVAMMKWGKGRRGEVDLYDFGESIDLFVAHLVLPLCLSEKDPHETKIVKEIWSSSIDR